MTIELAQPEAQIVVRGVLERDAEARRATSGAWLLMLQIRLGDCALPWEAVKQYGHDEAGAFACIEHAGQLHRGALVRVHANAFNAHLRGGDPRIALLAVDEIEVLAS